MIINYNEKSDSGNILKQSVFAEYGLRGPTSRAAYNKPPMSRCRHRRCIIATKKHKLCCKEDNAGCQA